MDFPFGCGLDFPHSIFSIKLHLFRTPPYFIKVQKIDCSRGLVEERGLSDWRMKCEEIFSHFGFQVYFLLWNPIFGPFRYTGSWKEVEKVEEIHCDETEEEGKEKSVDACGGSDDDIHGGGISSENRRRVLSHWNFWSKKSFGKFPCNSYLSIQNLTFCWGGRAERNIWSLERKLLLIQLKKWKGCTSNENIVGASILGATPGEVVYQVKEVEGDQKERKEEEKSEDDWGGADHHIHCGGRVLS